VHAILYAFGEEGIDAVKDFTADETLETFSWIVAVSAHKNALQILLSNL